MQKTFSLKAGDITREWFVIDASSQILGRLASQIAVILRGKHKAIYSPHLDTGDFVVVTNAATIRVTGNKAIQKQYHRHTGYPGGIRSRSFQDALKHCSQKVLKDAVKGMLPKGPLGMAMLKKLKVYADSDHPHTAQQPTAL